jgi:hypothetical protein
MSSLFVTLYLVVHLDPCKQFSLIEFFHDRLLDYIALFIQNNSYIFNSAVEAAVEEGRCVFDNLIKFLVWALPTNLGQGLVIIVAVFAGVPLPILPVQSLWINMTTAGTLGLMLAFEPRESGLIIQIRSASRLGYSDLGKNRSRMEDIRREFAGSGAPFFK